MFSTTSPIFQVQVAIQNIGIYRSVFFLSVNAVKLYKYMG
jgi:hypothetical protein